MAALAKTSTKALLDAAEEILARDGVEAVTMQATAAAVGVKAPSLYKHFDDRSALLEALEARVATRFAEALAAPGTGAALRDLLAIADRYRRFAKAEPHAYALLFSTAVPWTAAVAGRRRDVMAAPLHLLTGLVGAERAFDALCALTAFLHGFVSMENQSAFHFADDIERTYAFSVDSLVTGLLMRAAKP